MFVFTSLGISSCLIWVNQQNKTVEILIKSPECNLGKIKSFLRKYFYELEYEDLVKLTFKAKYKSRFGGRILFSKKIEILIDGNEMLIRGPRIMTNRIWRYIEMP